MLLTFFLNRNESRFFILVLRALVSVVYKLLIHQLMNTQTELALSVSELHLSFHRRFRALVRWERGESCHKFQSLSVLQLILVRNVNSRLRLHNGLMFKGPMHCDCRLLDFSGIFVYILLLRLRLAHP